MKIIQYAKEDLNNLKQLISPNNAESFFANLKIYPGKQMTVHNLILGLFIFSGYFLGLGYYSPIKYSFVTSFKIAFLYYIVAVSIPTILGYLLHLFSEKLVNKKVKTDEGITIASYSAGIGLISGIFRTFTETWVLHIILMAYSIYLFYIAIKTRFGFEKAIFNFLFLMTLTFIAAMILLKIIAVILGIQNFYY